MTSDAAHYTLNIFSAYWVFAQWQIHRSACSVTTT